MRIKGRKWLAKSEDEVEGQTLIQINQPNIQSAFLCKLTFLYVECNNYRHEAEGHYTFCRSPRVLGKMVKLPRKKLKGFVDGFYIH